jgi:hypothetical protein
MVIFVECIYKKIEGFPMFFVVPCVQPNLTTYTSSHGVREPISAATSFDLLRKRGVIMEDVNVSNVRER